MPEDLLWTVGIIVLGLLFGLATLPWRAKLSGERAPWYLLTWVFLWPYLLLYSVGWGLQRYRRAWLDYRAEMEWRKRTQKPPST